MIEFISFCVTGSGSCYCCCLITETKQKNPFTVSNWKWSKRCTHIICMTLSFQLVIKRKKKQTNLKQLSELFMKNHWSSVSIFNVDECLKLPIMRFCHVSSRQLQIVLALKKSLSMCMPIQIIHTHMTKIMANFQFTYACWACGSMLFYNIVSPICVYQQYLPASPKHSYHFLAYYSINYANDAEHEKLLTANFSFLFSFCCNFTAPYFHAFWINFYWKFICFYFNCFYLDSPHCPFK